jgi:DNA-3-methyladenine glycosylase II
VDEREIVNEKDVGILIDNDATMSMIHEKYGVPPNWTRPGGFVSLSKIILEQQVSIESAIAHFNKLNAYVSDFTPGNILHLTGDEMRACQISRQKAGYLKELATAIVDDTIDFNKLHREDDKKIKEQLMNLKGIGHWTADIYLLLCMQATDIFPLGDIALVNTMKELTVATSREDMLDYADRWRPNRSLATFFLWHYYLSKRNRTTPM